MGVREAELNRRRILAAVAFICSATVLGAASIATVAIAAGSPEALRWPFRMMCHGQLDRAFDIAGVAMPLCARCCGIYAGIAIAAVGMVGVFPKVRSRILFALGMLVVSPMVIDGAFQTIGLWSTGNLARAATGLAFGIGLVILTGNGLSPEPGRADVA